MSKPEQDQIDAEFEKARWVSLKLPAMVTAEEVRFGRKVWRLGYLAGVAAERKDWDAAFIQFQAKLPALDVQTDYSAGARYAMITIKFMRDRIRQRGEAGEQPEEE